MAAYQQAKAELFAWPSLKTAIVNLNDAASQLMLQKCSEAGFQPKTIGYGIADIGHSIVLAREKTEQYLLASNLKFSNAGIAFDLESSWGNTRVNVQLHGEFNVSNALAVLATWLAFGVSLQSGVDKLKRLKPVQGRLQPVEVPEESSRTTVTALPLVFVDYAHTPDALNKALLALHPLAAARNGQLWCVFGAGGDRDKGKRPLMATAVQRTAQKIVVTSDNPRSEDPLTIVEEILKGFDGMQLGLELGNVSSIVDRRDAIEHSIGQASVNDVILLAGKGHEPYQEIRGVRYPFSDVAVATAALQKKVLQ
jgi:UDP-N-acetylmuramoyl-L-alanyl-D-glutamate--2,6-diaminopimelate ligase